MRGNSSRGSPAETGREVSYSSSTYCRYLTSPKLRPGSPPPSRACQAVCPRRRRASRRVMTVPAAILARHLFAATSESVMQLRYRMLVFKLNRLPLQDRISAVEGIALAGQLAEQLEK